MLPIAAFRQVGGRIRSPLEADPPSLTVRLEDFPSFRLQSRRSCASLRSLERRRRQVEWHRASSVGLPYSGRLVDGTQLPVEGVDWVTWNPATDSSPNLPGRLWGHERTIRAIVSVLAGYRAAHPDAPRVVVGDISGRDGGRLDEHVSHQNGLDVDVYYPRLDGRATAPIATSRSIASSRRISSIASSLPARGSSSSATGRGYAGRPASSSRTRTTRTTCTCASPRLDGS